MCIGIGTRSMSSAAVPLWILAVIATAVFLREAQTLFVPMAIAVLLAFAVHPAVVWLERVRVPRTVGAAVIVLVLVAGLAGGVWALRDDFSDAVSRLPTQMRELRQELGQAGDAGWLSRLRQALAEMRKTAEAAQIIGGGPPAGPAPAESGGVQQFVLQGPSNLIALAGHATAITFLLYFLLISAHDWRRRLMAVAGDLLHSRRAGTDVIDDIVEQIQRFLVARVVTAVIVGVATWLALLALGGPAPAFWGAAAGLLNSVPYFGPIIVAAALAMVGLFAGGLSLALQLSAVSLVITGLEGWLLTPLLLGKASRMNTLAVFLSLLVWTWIWGVWGTLLAVPMTTILKAASDHVDRLQSVSKLLGR
jgi:predicted PurR-regulated permease PerM